MTYKEYLEGFIGARGTTESGVFWVGRSREGRGTTEISEVLDDFLILKEYDAEGAFVRRWTLPLSSFWMASEAG
ncbi:MAG: hypothetical protein U0411_09185 [Thermodesulfovibrionales bacterium]